MFSAGAVSGVRARKPLSAGAASSTATTGFAGQVKPTTTTTVPVAILPPNVNSRPHGKLTVRFGEVSRFLRERTAVEQWQSVRERRSAALVVGSAFCSIRRDNNLNHTSLGTGKQSTEPRQRGLVRSAHQSGTVSAVFEEL
uniref:Uncharacterized protein n=1 Tax=Anopheles aquasalis TaxID=42839 RepID=T1DN35_ANOAQ